MLCINLLVNIDVIIIYGYTYNFLALIIIYVNPLSPTADNRKKLSILTITCVLTKLKKTLTNSKYICSIRDNFETCALDNPATSTKDQDLGGI